MYVRFISQGIVALIWRGSILADILLTLLSRRKYDKYVKCTPVDFSILGPIYKIQVFVMCVMLNSLYIYSATVSNISGKDTGKYKCNRLKNIK